MATKIYANELDLCDSELKHFDHKGQYRALSLEDFQKLLERLLGGSYLYGMVHQVSLVCVDL